MKTYECVECGKVMEAKDWVYCANRHKEIAMSQVLEWGKNGLPTEMKV